MLGVCGFLYGAGCLSKVAQGPQPILFGEEEEEEGEREEKKGGKKKAGWDVGRLSDILLHSYLTSSVRGLCR